MAATDMTHDEIWDDSALIESWNQALDEYKKYHSIHVKGGTVEDVSDSHAPRESQCSAKPEMLHDNGPLSENTTTAAHLNPEAVKEVSDSGTSLPRSQASLLGSAAGNSHVTNIAVGPQAVLGSIQDDGLKKLLMSWYYAGYYTGLYEGQQHASTRDADEPRKRS